MNIICVRGKYFVGLVNINKCHNFNFCNFDESQLMPFHRIILPQILIIFELFNNICNDIP